MAFWLTVNASSMRDPISPKERWMTSEVPPHEALTSMHINTQSHTQSEEGLREPAETLFPPSARCV